MQRAAVKGDSIFKHDFSRSRYFRAIDVVVDPATGKPACRSAVDGSDRACVPYDIWRLGGATPEAIKYLETPGLQNGVTAQTIYNATIAGDLRDYGVRFPGSRDAVDLAIGVERRTDRLVLETDPATATGDLAGTVFEFPSVNASQTVRELFGEVRVPIFDSLQLSGAYRRSVFSNNTKTDTFGAGFNAQPVKTLRVRGSYQKAARAANLNELYYPRIGAEWGLSTDGPGDPCAGATPSRPASDCQRTGVTPAQYGNIVDAEFGGYPGSNGGNSALTPETGKTYTLGLVFAPSSQLSATIDYYDIEISDTIRLDIDPALVFTRCLDTGEPRYCSRVRRDSSFGSLWRPGATVDATGMNLGRRRVSGVDVAMNYRLKAASRGVFLVDLMGTWLREWSSQADSSAEVFQCAGYFGFGDCFRPLPKWRHRLRGTWQSTSSFDLSATWRYFGVVKNSDAGTAVITTHLPSANYIDLAGTWNFSKRLTLRGGVNNVADRDPPIFIPNAAGAVNGNTFVQSYDALGRHFFVTLTAKY
jgi:outer membrane receptor protein involved in Fe transport